MQNAALQWLKQNGELPDWYWVRHTRTITVTKELLIRFYREYKLYSDDDIADLYFGDEAPVKVEAI
jgi:ribosomal protein L39E